MRMDADLFRGCRENAWKLSMQRKAEMAFTLLSVDQ